MKRAFQSLMLGGALTAAAVMAPSRRLRPRRSSRASK